MCADFRESSGVSLLAACDVEVPPRECAQKGGAARVDAQKIGPEWWTPGRPDRLQYSWISVVVLYKPRSLPLATKAACDRWQRLLATCTATAPTVLFPDNNRVAQNLTAVTACVAARMPHRGALHIYTAIPAPRTIGLARGGGGIFSKIEEARALAPPVTAEDEPLFIFNKFQAVLLPDFAA